MANEQEIFIYLDKNSITLFDGGSPIKLDIPTNIIHDLDVVDKSGFDSLIETFIKTRKINPANIWIILSESMCFSKDFNEKDPSKLESQVKEFLEAIPFDEIVSKQFSSQNGIRVIATNFQLLESIGDIFERFGFAVAGIVPGVIFPKYSSAGGFTDEFAKIATSNKNLMIQANMLQKIETPRSQPPEQGTVPTKSKLLPYLLIGFGVLLVILLTLVFIRMRS